MKSFRYPVLMVLCLSWLSMVWSDPREQAIAKASAHVPRTPPQNAWLAHDIPAVAGDSGGPLLSSDFKLVGLTSRAMRTWGAPQTLSCCPTAQFVQELIASRKLKTRTPLEPHK